MPNKVVYHGSPTSEELRASVRALQPFTPNATCPKCLSDGGHRVTSAWKVEGFSFGPPEDEVAAEWMERRCTGCSYAWREKVADAT